tara:strand:+ start:79 stop:345 length:267 start_codon:yes stop_codon:yes gene_type:complete
MSKSRRTLESPDVKSIRNGDIRLPLFIKKSNDEGLEFYFMGEVIPIDSSIRETKMATDDGKVVSVVDVIFQMKSPVDLEIYKYITKSN